MLYRKIEKEEVSLLGIGCMRFPTIDDKIDKEKTYEMLKYAVDNNINYFDTAYIYHNGQSESFIGEFIEEYNLREKIKLATKLPSWLIKNHEDMYKYLDEQLNNLKTDYIDFYLMHSLNKEDFDNLVKCGVFEFLDDIKRRGKAKYVGFSFHDSFEVFKEIVDSYEWDFAQIQYNYIDEEYQAGTKGLKYAHEKGLAVVIMEPLRGGKLANNISEDILDNIKHTNKSAVELGFEFLYDKEEISVVLSGMSTIEQIKENIEIVDKYGKVNSLTPDEKVAISNLRDAIREKMVVRCTNCRYCVPCPMNVEIPKAFEVLNNASMFEDVDAFRYKYRALEKDNIDPSRCIKCGKCEKICPQNIDIINKLELVKNTFKEK